MRYYFSVYKTILKLNFSQLLVYRANFYNALVSGVGYTILSFLIIVLLTSKTPIVFGWKREELLFLMGIYNILVGGIFHICFSKNFNFFAQTIDLGKLDPILLKPINDRFLMSCMRVNFVNVIRIFIGLAVVIYIVFAFNIKIKLYQYVLFLSLSFFSLLLLYSIWFTVMTLTIWNTRLSNLVNLLYQLNDFSKFPPQVFYAKNYLFFIIPYTFIIAAPTKVLLQKVNSYDIVGLIFLSLVFYLLSVSFWNFALKFYTSASS